MVAVGRAVRVLRMRPGVVFPTAPSLKVSRAPGVSLSLTGEDRESRERHDNSILCCYSAWQRTSDEPCAQEPLIPGHRS